MKNIILSALFVVNLIGASGAFAEKRFEQGAMLKFENGQLLTELSEINKALNTVGVLLERIDVPQQAIPLLKAAMEGPLSNEQKQQLLAMFSLSPSDVVNQALKSGRQPVLPGGGSMTSGEVGNAPYPKVYDLQSMNDQDRRAARDKFARLHVNTTDEMIGVDEVMTNLVGGAWTWYFQIGDQAVELHMSKVQPGDSAWRLNYPGNVPHGGFFHAKAGLTVAYITGPETWTMRYKAPSQPNNPLLGTNPFVDFDK